MEHRFLSPRDDFIHCIAICRQRIINCSVDEVMSQLLGGNLVANGGTSTDFHPSARIGPDSLENGDVMTKLKPELPTEIAKWMEYNEISSKKLRSGC